MTKKEIIETGREVLEIEARAVEALSPRLDDSFARAVDLLYQDEVPDHRHRHGQVGPRRPQDRGHAGELRHAGHVRPSGRSRATATWA